MKGKFLFWAAFVTKFVTWILSMLAIYWIILKLTDHSPTSDQVMLTMLSIIASGVLGLIALLVNFLMRFSNHVGKMNRYVHESDRRFEMIERRFQKIDERFDKIEHKIDRCLACRNFRKS